MKNINLLDDIKDEENKFCNYLNSYIIFTKIASNEYRLKIHLSCPKKEKTKEEQIICNNKECSRTKE